MLPDFRKILAVLSRHQIPFIVIGGHAVIQHGYVRATEDIDIIFQRSKESEESLLKALTEISACWISNEKDPFTGLEKLVPVDISYIKNNHLMMLSTEFGYLDIFDYLPGFPNETLEAVFSRSISLNGVKYLSLPDLIRMKKASGRPKDINDILELEE